MIVMPLPYPSEYPNLKPFLPNKKSTPTPPAITSPPILIFFFPRTISIDPPALKIYAPASTPRSRTSWRIPWL